MFSDAFDAALRFIHHEPVDLLNPEVQLRQTT
jgi:hypothetical protein